MGNRSYQELADAQEEFGAALLGVSRFNTTEQQRERYELAMHALLHAEIRAGGLDPATDCGECEEGNVMTAPAVDRGK